MGDSPRCCDHWIYLVDKSIGCLYFSDHQRGEESPRGVSCILFLHVHQLDGIGRLGNREGGSSRVGMVFEITSTSTLNGWLEYWSRRQAGAVDITGTQRGQYRTTAAPVVRG